MRVIITGGTGLVGTALSTYLVEKGYEVVTLSRSPNQAAAPAGVQVVQWDGKTAVNWGHLANGAAAIINLAGASIAGGRWTEERKREIINSRVNAGKAVVEAITQASHKPEFLFQASAVGYYGNGGDQLLTETAPIGSDFPANVTQAWEPATAAVEAMGVRRVVGRIGVVLSTNGGALPQMALPFRLFAGGPVGSGQQWLSWIHLDDLVHAIHFFMQNPDTSGSYNLAAPEPVRNKAFGKVIGSVLKRPFFMPAPAFALKLLFGEMSTILLEGQRVSADKLQKAGFTFIYPAVEPALADLLG